MHVYIHSGKTEREIEEGKDTEVKRFFAPNGDSDRGESSAGDGGFLDLAPIVPAHRKLFHFTLQDNTSPQYVFYARLSSVFGFADRGRFDRRPRSFAAELHPQMPYPPPYMQSTLDAAAWTSSLFVLSAR
jgi:hypothetical protein